MSNLFLFKSKSEIDSDANLKDFINRCRYELTVFGADLDWDSHKWPIRRGPHFTKLGVRGDRASSKDWLANEYIDFAKAYLRYQQGHHPTENRSELMALKTIEMALIQVNSSASVAGLNVAVLDEASLIAKNYYSPGPAYLCGCHIEKLAKFVSDKYLIPANLSDWRNPVRKPSDDNIRTGPIAQKRRDKKLPSQEALDAMAEVFALSPKNPRDIFTTCVYAMTLCAPVRISEIMELPADCEHEELDSHGVMRYGWRFYSAKGFGPNIKWIPDVMVPIAKEAIKRIKIITDEPRRLALWLERSPEQVFRHDLTPQVGDETPLTRQDVVLYIGMAGVSLKRAIRDGLYENSSRDPNFSPTLRYLWDGALKKKPPNFPWAYKKKGIKYSNALFCMHPSLLNSRKKAKVLELWIPTKFNYGEDLSPRNDQRNHKTIFDRYGYRDVNGERIKATSHQNRHLLNTMANRGGLYQKTIAHWSGRANQRENLVYNHVTEYEVVAKAEALDPSLSLFGPVGEHNIRPPITLRDLNLTERGPVHITEYGACIHDYTWSPCQKFRDCLNCEEQVCIKGDQVKLERIKARLAEVEIDYAEAEKAIKEGFYGADRWYEFHEKTIIRLRQLVDILENPEIHDGTQVKLRDGNDYSHLNRVLKSEVFTKIQGCNNLSIAACLNTSPPTEKK